MALYSPDQDSHTPDRLALVAELRSAIFNGGLTVLYQPKADMKTGRITGVEALVRWKHPRHGMLNPSDFVTLAEQTGLIKPLTFYVLEEALKSNFRWRREGLDLMVAVNLSVHNLLDVNLPAEVQRLITKWAAPPDSLEFEITEGSIMADPDRAMRVLDELSGMGINLAIDDFGTGYSSLSYLKQLPVHALKIDRSFVSNMTADEDDLVIVRSTIDLGHSLGLEIVAEGVEDEYTWSVLDDLKCDTVQGFLLSKPITGSSIPAIARTLWARRDRAVASDAITAEQLFLRNSLDVPSLPPPPPPPPDPWAAESSLVSD
jgi:EAL domain-containing protein (putative c-di-GMP-specific phosphodiesterase class I)